MENLIYVFQGSAISGMSKRRHRVALFLRYRSIIKCQRHLLLETVLAYPVPRLDQLILVRDLLQNLIVMILEVLP